MEFKICQNDDIFRDPDQECFDARLPLRVGNLDIDPAFQNWERRMPVEENMNGLILRYIQLPTEIESCDQCILQWTYQGGNNWGKCKNGTEGTVCPFWNRTPPCKS